MVVEVEEKAELFTKMMPIVTENHQGFSSALHRMDACTEDKQAALHQGVSKLFFIFQSQHA